MNNARPSKKRVCVIGAGVIGLSTAVRILEESQKEKVVDVEVTVVADRFSPHTTSDGSGGFWEPFAIGDTPTSLLRKWGYATWEHMLQLATSADLAATVGAQFVSGYQIYTFPQSEEPFYKDALLGFRGLTRREMDMFPFARDGHFFTSLQINVQKYLPWLMQRFKKAGGKIQHQRVDNLSEVAEHYEVVVNCAGLRGGVLVADPLVLPIRGQLIRVRAPWVKHFYLFDGQPGKPSYILPLGEEVLVGGLKQEHNWREDVDKEDTDEIWTRAVTCFPFLQGGQRIREWTGLRPGRSCVRLEREEVRTKAGRTVPVVHNYGHGGGGVTLHWGCAADATHLVLSSLLPRPPLPAPHSKIVLLTKMASEEVKLMTPEELAEQEQWDEEFKRRQEDMARRELQSRERRIQVSSKMQELDQRWRMMEQRRVLRSREATTPSSQGL